MDQEVISFGPYAVPVILTVILGVAYKVINFGDRFKALIAVVIGVALGLLSIPYKGIDWSVVNIVDHAIYGLMIGASATGLYELQRTVTKPRP